MFYWFKSLRIAVLIYFYYKLGQKKKVLCTNYKLLLLYFLAFKRICCRCRKTYYVDADGDYVREEECDFHWGRLWKKRSKCKIILFAVF